MSAPTRNKHVMVDIETMGLPPDGAIVAIGAVPFSTHRERLVVADEDEWFYCTISLAENHRAGRAIEPSTVEWWMRQSSEARAELSQASTDLAFARTELRVYFEVHRFEFVWAKPPAFDLAMLEDLYDGAPPWGRRASRDVRTALAIAKDAGWTDVLALPREGVHHRADHDAAHQARQVVEVMRRVYNIPFPPQCEEAAQ